MAVDIGSYHVEGELVAVGNGQVAPATDAFGARRFIKVFDKYVMPSEEALATGHAAALRRKERFEAYQARMEAINLRLAAACGSTASLVTATDFFRDGSKLVKVTDYVDFDRRPASQVHEVYTKDQIYNVFRSVLTSVQTLHGQGVVHADLKPENVFICGEGDAAVGRVSDFDDSFFASEVPDACDVTSSLEYYSPELARYVAHAEDPDDALGRAGSPLAAAVGRTHDIFALGLVLHLYLTGTLPQVRGGGYVFEGLLRHGDAGIRLSPGLAYRDAALIRWMLRCDPARRPQTCAEVLNALNSDGRGIPSARVRVAADGEGAPLVDMRAYVRFCGEEVARVWGSSRGRATLEVLDVSPDRLEVRATGRTCAGRTVRGEWSGAFPSAEPAPPVCFHWAGGALKAVDANPAVRPAPASFATDVKKPRPLVRPGEGRPYEPAEHGPYPDRSLAEVERGRLRGLPCDPALKRADVAPAARTATGRDPEAPCGGDRGEVVRPEPEPDIVLDPPRDGRYVSLTRAPGERVLVRLADDTVMNKPLRELPLYGLRDCMERLEALVREKAAR